MGDVEDPRSGPPPEIAVVIPTHDRETRLGFALEALARQTLDPERFEVIVVRSEAATGPNTEAPPGLDVRFLTHSGARGAGPQRNAGWSAARAPLVAFTDDDCRPAPDWLERLLSAWEGDQAIVQGRTEPDPSESHLLFGLARSNRITALSDRFETCNIAYPRALLERLGGFDEGVASNDWGEDTDLGLRALAMGARCTYVDRAVVWHAVLPMALADAIRDANRHGALVALLARYPEHRRRLYPRGVVKESHVTLPVALLGVTQLRRRPLIGLIAIAPYVSRSLQRHLDANPLTIRKLARFGLHLPLAAAVEAAEVAATARAAVRHRVPII